MGAAREKWRPLKADEIGLVEIWRFDLGNLMAHGCGKGKIATTKSRWDRTCGALSWEIEWRMGAAREKERPLKADEIGFLEIWRFDLGNAMAPVVSLRCVSPGRRLELLAPTASLLRTVWTVSSCKRLPGEIQRRGTTEDTTGKWYKMRKSWIATTTKQMR